MSILIFIIYQLITWNREVLTPLTDLKQDINLLNIPLRIFKKFLTVEINKVYGCDLRINRSRSGPSDSLKMQGSIILDTHSDDDSEIDSLLNDINFQFYNSNLFYNNSLTYGLGSNYPLCINDSKNTILEEIYTFDFQANYFLEQ